MYRVQLKLLAAAILLSGCATSGAMRTSPLGEGIARVFSAELEKVLNAAQESMVEAGLAIEEVTKVDDNTHLILGTKGLSVFSYGELVRLVVERSAPSETTVRVYTKRRLATNITAKGDYSGAIFSRIESKLQPPP